MSGETHTEQYRILDAGCGAGSSIVDRPPNAFVVGIDSSEIALSRNETIDQAIVGDVETYNLPASSFDEVVCLNVLEHLAEPERALRNLAQSLKPGGRLVVGVPNLLSAKGLVARFTPHRFHIWFYRHFFPESDEVALPGYGPWPTYLRWSIRPAGLRRIAESSGLVVDSIRVHEYAGWRAFWDRQPLLRLACRVIWPFGDPRLTECTLIAHR